MENLPDVSPGQRVEHDDLVYPVQELRPDGLLEHIHQLPLALVQHLAAGSNCGSVCERILSADFRQPVHIALDNVRADIGSHYYNRILEVHGTPLVVGQTAVIKHLKQNVEHIRMRLLDFVEENHRVWLAPNGLGQLAALIVSYISRRRTYKTADCMTFLILGHINPRYHILIIEQELRESLGQLCLAHAGGTHEEERTDWAFLIGKTGTTSSDSVCNSPDGLVLANDPVMELVLHPEKFGLLALQHLAHRYACPP